MATKFSPTVNAAYVRRLQRLTWNEVKFEWFLDKVSDKLAMTMRDRVRVAAERLRDKVVRNLSVPVTKVTGKRGRVIVTERSKSGEAPRAETSRLMRDIFTKVFESQKGVWDGAVGTTLEYGLILETKMNRSFLVRSLEEERQTIERILAGPIE